MAGDYIVRRVTTKGVVREETYDDLAVAFASLVACDGNPIIEYAELVADKGYGAPAREGKKLIGAAAVAAWLKEEVED